jgi:predicted negative regulator of RcsB-dependent stress response
MRWIALVFVLGALAVLAGWSLRESSRRQTFAEAIDHGQRMAENLRFGEAVMAYEAALDLPLEADERAEVRYRLARCKIEGNDLNGALGVLQELTEEDVARFQIDVGPLYLMLGERAQRSGMMQLARIAYREGGGVSPPRYEEFARRLEQLTEDERAARAADANANASKDAKDGG